MIVNKKLKTTLFGEEVLLDFGIRFSGRLRILYPDWADIFESQDGMKLMIMALMSALPESMHNKTENEVIDELDRLDDPMLLHYCAQGFKDAMGFFTVALNGAVNAAVAVENASPKKNHKQQGNGTKKS